MSKADFTKVPNATINYEGIEYYNDGLERLRDLEIELTYVSPNEIRVAGKSLDYLSAHSLYTDIKKVSTDAATNAASGSHPFLVETRTAVYFLPDAAEPGDSELAEILEWLEYALGLEEYEGPEIWEASW